MTPTKTRFDEMLERRLRPEALEWLRRSDREIDAGASAMRLASLLSQASRHAPRGLLEPTAEEKQQAADGLPGWNPERWTTLEALRVRLLVAHPDPAGDAFPEALEECFRYADQGELQALYRALAHLPGGERFAWRAGEGCRTNLKTVFEATACDTPYPAHFFDEVAWRQLVIKAVFIEAPLWRVYGLDRRLSPEMARMALDLADERRSAGRPIPHELWLCLGVHAGDRGLAALEHELGVPDPRARRAAVLALARAGATDRLRDLAEKETDPDALRSLADARAGRCDQTAFAALAAEGS
ncbi:MAG: hypothetical protein FJ144_00190 [Deltaproteobacteria bacterium]|nr:hypothetical protein [Deltaproteobacteria bacterium]